MRKRATSIIITAAIAATAGALAAPASAHVTGQTYGSTPTSGGYGQVFLRVPHGCGADATNTIRVQIPEGVTAVKPQQKAGWTVETVSGPAGISEVTWTGGNLPNSQFDDFGLSVKWPKLAHGEASRAVYFKTVQECDADVRITRNGKKATVTGMFPELAGKQVGVFVDGTRLSNTKVAADGTLSLASPTGRIPAGSIVTIMRGGQQIGTSVNGTEAWVNIPAHGQDSHSVEGPAPSVTVVAATGHGGH